MKYLELSYIQLITPDIDPVFFDHFRRTFGEKMEVSLENFYTLKSDHPAWHLPGVLAAYIMEHREEFENNREYWWDDGVEKFYNRFIEVAYKPSTVDKIVKAAYQ